MPSFSVFAESVKEQPIYVILGVQGSGTNLLRDILVGAFGFSVVKDQALVYNAAVAVGVHPTADVVQRTFDSIRARLLPSPLTRKTLRRIKSNGSFKDIEKHFDPATIASGPALARFVYAYSAFSLNTPLMAIKSDDLWETISHIDSVLPNRRVVLLTRDFRDNLLSISKKAFGPVEPLLAAQYVKERFACYEAEYRRTPEKDRLHVRFEDLLEAPDTFVARFCDHFGLAAKGLAPREVDTRRIRRNNMRKWAALPTSQLAQCEAVLWDELHTYGYGTESATRILPSSTTWMLATGRDIAKRIPQKFKNLLARAQK